MDDTIILEVVGTSRTALSEIPASSKMQTVSNNRWSIVPPPSYLSPALSPDELVIQQRGRKRLPLSWSPDINLRGNCAFHSNVRAPAKESDDKSPGKFAPSSRSTPRKRLFVGESEQVALTPDKLDYSDISTPPKFKTDNFVTPVKERKLQNSEIVYSGSLQLGLKGLSTMQLIDMITSIANKHPDIEKEIRAEMPVPDLRPYEENLRYLKSNIFKSLPGTRLASKTDGLSYTRAVTHLLAFKKCLVEQGKLLVESQHWESVMEYVFLAWSYVKGTPLWDNESHNNTRKVCFKSLITFCKSALSEGDFNKILLIDIQEKLQSLTDDCGDVAFCIKHIQSLIKELD